MIMGYRLVQAVLVVNLGKLGDMFGRVKMYNAGFVVFTIASILLSFDPYRGGHGAMWLIGWRFLQAIGGSMLMANSAAILTDAFPAERRGFALGTNQIAALAGMFIGLVAGGLLAAWDWRAVFWINLPVGVFGTLWAYLKLRDNGVRNPAKIDWWGNITFAARPRLGAGRRHLRHPALREELDGLGVARRAGRDHRRPRGAARLPGHRDQDRRADVPAVAVQDPRVRRGQRRRPARVIARGGIQFMLIIWLQGIWLPLHGYSYDQTPLWAGIFLLPMTAGFLVSGPTSGILSDRFGSRGIASAGMAVFASSFIALMLLPVNFPYWAFALLHRAQRDRQRHVRLAELVLDHGLGPPARPGRGVRHALHVPELGHRRVHRRRVHADDRRPVQLTARHPERRPGQAGRANRHRPPGGYPARRSPRCSRRSSALTRSSTCWHRPACWPSCPPRARRP
jgi:MFS family permease